MFWIILQAFKIRFDRRPMEVQVTTPSRQHHARKL